MAYYTIEGVLDLTTGTLSFHTGHMAPSTAYVFTLKLMKGDRSIVTEQVLEVSEGAAPELIAK